MDKPLMYYILPKNQDHLKKHERTRVICVKDETLPELTKHPDVFELDWDYFFQKQVLDQLEEFDLIPTVKTAISEYREMCEVNV